MTSPAPVGDGVNSQATFLARKAALRADPLNLSYINWAGSSVFSNRYENNDLYPNNHIKPNYTFPRDAQARHPDLRADHGQRVALSHRRRERLAEHVGTLAALLRPGVLPRPRLRCGALPDVQ